MKLDSIINEVSAEFASKSSTARMPSEVSIIYRTGNRPEDVVPISEAPDQIKKDARSILKALLMPDENGVKKYKQFWKNQVPEIDMKARATGGYTLTSDDRSFVYKVTYNKSEKKWNFSRI